jgi:hypothetical protein
MDPNTPQPLLNTLDAALAVQDRGTSWPAPPGTVPPATSSSESVTLLRRPGLRSHLRSDKQPPARRTDPGPPLDVSVLRPQAPLRTAPPIDSSEESVQDYGPAQYVD